MAAGKYQYWLTEDGRTLLQGWARDGLTDEQIAEKCGITRSTLSEWKKKYPDISDTLKKGKEIVDREVENALLKKTKGYNVEIKKTFKVRKIDYDPNTGKKVREYEELQTGYDEVHVPADTTAQIYWLNNRKPEMWRTRTEKISSAVSDENNIFEVIDESTREELDTSEIPEIEPPAEHSHNVVE